MLALFLTTPHLDDRIGKTTTLKRALRLAKSQRRERRPIVKAPHFPTLSRLAYSGLSPEGSGNEGVRDPSCCRPKSNSDWIPERIRGPKWNWVSELFKKDNVMTRDQKVVQLSLVNKSSFYVCESQYTVNVDLIIKLISDSIGSEILVISAGDKEELKSCNYWKGTSHRANEERLKNSRYNTLQDNDNYLNESLRSECLMESVQPTVLQINYNDAPPSFEEAVSLDAPPPSYESLFGQIREVHEKQKHISDLLQNISIILLGTIGYTIIVFAIPACMIIIAAFYFYDCPEDKFIPFYLLVGGGFEVFNKLFFLCTNIQIVNNTIMNTCRVGWFILGSVSVYKVYEPNYDPALGKYCNKTLYLFAFYLITLGYIIIALEIFYFCVICLVSAISKFITMRESNM
ncbi:PREDICTED: uncharacterized protein LOC105359997 [Ceratosolen solmsi marchali]|uniref:Uncharacterized protein LOC105359997 n=1 Tax=Ceratosolen solmsi marchali TaxID=326594 RepID=A0AAJ6VME9_9HYME|nr:PREDICTED: uncharacterized protein LOC105359997 [Ceratosolen solmsi marchali]